MINVSWSTLRDFAVAKSLSIQYVDADGNYYLAAIDAAFRLDCVLNKTQNVDEVAEFEATYKTNGNRTLTQKMLLDDGNGNVANQLDTDNALIVRIKAAKRGWSFWAVPIEITTSTIGGSMYAKDSAGVDIPGITCKIYDSNNEEITTPGALNVNLAGCVKTVLDFEPAFDFEMIGGALRINSNPSQDVRLWVIGAPDIPAQFGGSKEFASGINLKFLAPDSSFEIDGRVSKYVTYSAVTHSGKLRVLLKHPAGLNLNLQFVIHTYRL